MNWKEVLKTNLMKKGYVYIEHDRDFIEFLCSDRGYTFIIEHRNKNLFSLKWRTLNEGPPGMFLSWRSGYTYYTLKDVLVFFEKENFEMPTLQLNYDNNSSLANITSTIINSDLVPNTDAAVYLGNGSGSTYYGDVYYDTTAGVVRMSTNASGQSSNTIGIIGDTIENRTETEDLTAQTETLGNAISNYMLNYNRRRR